MHLVLLSAPLPNDAVASHYEKAVSVERQLAAPSLSRAAAGGLQRLPAQLLYVELPDIIVVSDIEIVFLFFSFHCCLLGFLSFSASYLAVVDIIVLAKSVMVQVQHQASLSGA